MGAAVRMERVDFAGHAVSYCVFGVGQALVLIKPHRGRRVYEFARWLAARYTVIQIEPLGHGWSDRPRQPPAGGVHDQVHAVLDQEGVDRFIAWGYSAGGAMALAVASASPRATAMVCGGWSPADRQSNTALRRMEREQRVPTNQLSFWQWQSRINWMDTLEAMRIPRLVYVGTDDGPRVRGPRGVPRTRAALIERGVDVFEFDALDHLTCMSEPAFSTTVGPAVVEWLERGAVG